MKEDIQNFIPQRPPFIMIDNLMEVTGDYFMTDFRILPDNIFVENGLLREFAMIENIAQSSAAGLAFVRKQPHGQKPGGYIGAVSRLKLFELPKVNDRIYTAVGLIAQFENMFLLKGQNYCDSTKLMECEIKLVGN